MILPAAAPDATLSFDDLMRQSQHACDALSHDEDGLKRDILAHAGNRWSLGVVHALGVAGTLRHAEISRRLEGVTQRMLTRTLRQLERDGLIARHDYREVPPRVEYRLTDLGRGLLVGMLPLWGWVIDHAEEFRAARRRYGESG
ncbi:winged helix-turn-helix transcriptional regulator [Bordetella genomosp. 13]|uniref:winged helix-turn-helix transcriptional regulator n=1 Tax=Bordetella genomosp. 13 TaxID=463040 RepID=UPI0011A0A106|nr:helix-turn-helix domain-containing protein [Bordetella genomosp. 13]